MPARTKFTRREIIYRGRVQGVGFRHATRTIARHYDVTGSVQNLPDGTVRVVVEGEADELDRFMKELATRMSYFIHGTDSGERAPTGQYTDFEIMY